MDVANNSETWPSRTHQNYTTLVDLELAGWAATRGCATTGAQPRSQDDVGLDE